jgi:RNA polymerase sigma-70 factor (ECF subfamily)
LTMEPFTPKEPFSEAQFGQLFRDHFKELCFTALRYTKDMETAREIVQESFLHLWEKRDRIDPGRAVKSYLTVTVRNLSLNWLRDHRKFDNTLLSLEGIGPETEPESGDLLIAGEILQRIQEAVEELPDRCREVFTLNRYQELKYHEIADRLGISVKTVETQMSKALQHMRVRLKEFLPLALLALEKISHHLSG